MAVANETFLPKNKNLEACETGELVHGQIHRATEWAVVGLCSPHLMQVVILSGPHAPYWMNAYGSGELGVPRISCLSYGKDYTRPPRRACGLAVLLALSPNNTDVMDGDRAGAVAIRNDGYGMIINGLPDTEKKWYWNLKTFEVQELHPGQQASMLEGWSIWKNGMPHDGPQCPNLSPQVSLVSGRGVWFHNPPKAA